MSVKVVMNELREAESEASLLFYLFIRKSEKLLAAAHSTQDLRAMIEMKEYKETIPVQITKHAE